MLERDLTSPSIATLVDILESLGTDLKTFFSESGDEKLVFGEKDISVKEDEEVLKGCIKWLVPSAQKNRMEPILLELGPGGETDEDDPHEGEEFGYVLSGSVRHRHRRPRRARPQGRELLFQAHRPPQAGQRRQIRLPGIVGVHAPTRSDKTLTMEGIAPCTTSSA